MKNLMNITDLTVEEIDELIAVAEDIIANPVKYQDCCRHKLLKITPLCQPIRLLLLCSISSYFSLSLFLLK